MLDSQAIESLKNKIGGKPKVSAVGDGQMDVGKVCISDTYQDLLHVLADNYSVGILADPSIRPVDSAVHPQTIPGFKEYGMLWLDQNTRISVGTRERYIGLGPIKIKWFPKKMTAPSVRLTKASDYGTIPNPEYDPAPVQIVQIEPKS
ncbi:hypothetical protein HYY71_05000 [Candidatus Woesearchaeota archaeon]|nr:hypothetical protein [Candidatus Woesearchaeota archaeon]